MTEQQVLKEFRRCLNNLMEHCESVQIIATMKGESGGDSLLSSGHGNYYARYGAVKMWVLGEEKEHLFEVPEMEEEQ